MIFPTLLYDGSVCFSAKLDEEENDVDMKKKKKSMKSLLKWKLLFQRL